MLWKKLPSGSKSQLQDAIANLQKSADQGLSSGQCQLGNIYFMGHLDGGEPVLLGLELIPMRTSHL